MTYQSTDHAVAEQRAVARDPVAFRARAFGPDAEALSLLVVNLSPHGLMARIDTVYREGQRMRITLPLAGVVAAEVRWCLGGRLGLQFDQAIDPASYYEMLARILQP